MMDSNEKLEAILEGAIIASSEPLSLSKLSALFSKEEMPSAETINTALRAIQNNCEGRGFDLVQVASGWRFQVREEFATWVNRLWEEKPQKYSRALLETLALIAYRQPITRGDIEEVRGVAVSSHIIRTLMERDWVKIIGHRDVPGRPALYATTRLFLDYFNLKSLDELPTLGELKDIDALDGDLDLGEPPAMLNGNGLDNEDADSDSDYEEEQAPEILAEDTLTEEAEVDGEAMAESHVSGDQALAEGPADEVVEKTISDDEQEPGEHRES